MLFAVFAVTVKTLHRQDIGRFVLPAETAAVHPGGVFGHFFQAYTADRAGRPAEIRLCQVAAQAHRLE